MEVKGRRVIIRGGYVQITVIESEIEPVTSQASRATKNPQPKTIVIVVGNKVQVIAKGVIAKVITVTSGETIISKRGTTKNLIRNKAND